MTSVLANAMWECCNRVVGTHLWWSTPGVRDCEVGMELCAERG